MIDEHWIRSLHVESMRHADLHAERAAHVLFQASTIGALLDGAFDGDLTFAELGERGDLGLGTLNGLDGEMIALDGGFFRADVDGAVTPVGPEERTPFAVVTRFEPTVEGEVAAGLDHEAILAALDELAPAGESSFAVRLDGRFASVRARSVPRQSPPYRSLSEVVADQHIFELTEVEGTMVGFRFPAFVEGIEVAGYHLHFVDSARHRGGHVLGSRSAAPCEPGSTPPTTSTSSSLRPSTSPTPTWPPRPTPPSTPPSAADSPAPRRPSELRPGRLVTARAGCGRHETPGTWSVRGEKSQIRRNSKDPQERCRERCAFLMTHVQV